MGIIFLLGLTQKGFAYSADPAQFIQEIVNEAKEILIESNSNEFKSKKLSEIALKTATSSAQIVAGYEAFSILHPVYMFPESVTNAAPTRKLEYGACAFLAISFAKSANFLSISLIF